MRTIHRTARPDLVPARYARASLKVLDDHCLLLYLLACLLNFDVTHVREVPGPSRRRNFVLQSIKRIFACGRMFRSVVTLPRGTSGPNLMVRVFRRCPGVHIGQRVAPLPGHNQDRVLVQFGANQRVHLGHVAAQPEQPAGDRGQYQHALNDPSVGTLRGDNRQGDANHAEDGRENDDR